MKCNKVISIILSFVLCISCINIIDFHALAEEKELEIVYVSAVVNGNSQNMPAIKNKDGVVFFSGKTLSDITVYRAQKAYPFRLRYRSWSCVTGNSPWRSCSFYSTDPAQDKEVLFLFRQQLKV